MKGFYFKILEGKGRKVLEPLSSKGSWDNSGNEVSGTAIIVTRFFHLVRH